MMMSQWVFSYVCCRIARVLQLWTMDWQWR